MSASPHAGPVSRQKFAVEKRNERRPHRPKAWSHQDELKSLKGKLIKLKELGATTVTEGELLEADQFTLKIRRKTDKSILIYFKSALAFFGEV